MARLLRVGLLLGLVGFVFTPGAHAQVMGICAGWVPNSSDYCTTATPYLDIGTANSQNPTFNIAINSNGSTDGVELVILVPLSSTSAISDPLTFTATFTQSDGGPGGTVSAVLASTSPFTSSSGSLVSYAGMTAGSPSVNNYGFNNIHAVESSSGTQGFAVYTVELPGVSSGHSGSNYLGVSFNFSGGASNFPYGTIFLAYGTAGDPIATNFTPLTDGLTTVVPEPMSLTLFGTGLLGIALLVRRRIQKAP